MNFSIRIQSQRQYELKLKKEMSKLNDQLRMDNSKRKSNMKVPFSTPTTILTTLSQKYWYKQIKEADRKKAKKIKYYKTRFKKEDALFKNIDQTFKKEADRIIGGIKQVQNHIRRKERLDMYALINSLSLLFLGKLIIKNGYGSKNDKKYMTPST